MLQDFNEELEKLLEYANNNGSLKMSDISTFLVGADESDIDEAITYLSSLGYNIDEEDEMDENEPTELEIEESDSLQGNGGIEDDEEIDEEELKEYSEAIEQEIASGDFDEILSTNFSSDDPVKMYFRGIGQISRLTAQEEQLHAINVQQGLAAKARLEDCKLKGIELSDEELKKLDEEVRIGQNSREIMITSNLRLVVFIAKHYLGRGLQFLDLIQYGNVGLMKAVTKFDPTKGFKFATYATWWIKQGVVRALADLGRTIRVPVHLVETINKIAKVTKQLTAELRREPTQEEIAEAMNMSVEKIQQIQKNAQDPISLDASVGDDDDSNYSDIIPDTETMNPFEFTENENLNETLNEMLSSLTPKEEGIVRLRYGLDDNHGRTLEEIGNTYNITRERIRQITDKALNRLRRINSKTSCLEPFKNRGSLKK